MTTARTKKIASFLALLLAAGGGAACAASGRSPPATTRGVHPDVGASADTCSACHADATPEVARAWRDGRHGLELVECLVCHGSTGADFRLQPEFGSCAGCHPSEVRSVTRAAGGIQDCFSCHPAHALRPVKNSSPHGKTEGGRP
jgi:hypothetical protein